MDYKDELKQIVNSDKPVELLRRFATELNNDGLSKEDIYSIFYNYQLELQTNGNDAEADILGDVMDMITGWYSGRNLDLM